MPAANKAIIEEIVDQYFEEASFLWSQRDAAVTSPIYSLTDLAYLDERVEAHIDGLRVAGDYGWSLCEAGIAEDEPGTVFTATIIAFESGDEKRIELVTDAGCGSKAAFRAMVSGLGWMKTRQFNSAITQLVSAKSRPYRRLGIAACGIRRINPRTYLDKAINSADNLLKAAALKAAGELKRIDLSGQLQGHFEHEDDACRFAAAKSAVLLGDRSAMDILSTFVLSQSEYTLPAMQVALRVSDGQTARTWLKALSRNPDQRRLMLTGAGITGDPAYIPMLLKQMGSPEYARGAGEAFSMITGVDLTDQQLDAEWPEGFEAGPNDDIEDDDVGMDVDEDLPWPDADLINQWWKQNGSAFPAGSRYLAGVSVSPDTCAAILKTGNQRQRQAAALELALSQADTPYPNTKAPGNWQTISF